MIYLDYAANSPVNKEVIDLFYQITNDYIGNPNSSHKLGRDAAQVIQASTKKIAALLNVKENEIIYTSGATESNNLAIKGIAAKYKNKGKHMISTHLEHASVLAPLQALAEQGFELDFVDVLDNGLVDIEHLKTLMREDTILVSISYVDGELGIQQQIDEITSVLQNYPNCIFHSDATQAVGKIPIQLDKIDLVSFAPHKFYGLNGVGILVKKENIKLEPFIHGGKSTTLYRSGTPMTALVASTALALEKAVGRLEAHFIHAEKLNKKLRTELTKHKYIAINSTEYATPFILNLSMMSGKSVEIAQALDEGGIYVSVKSACCPPNTMSRAVYAVTKDKKKSLSTLRISLSHLTTEEEIDEFLKFLWNLL